jgi:lantibiotic modifying enzyme
MLIEAYLTFKNQSYLDAALKSGKSVWRNGLLRKGFGLCHGTCGNSYALMSLYKATGDIVWKQRAHMFLLWTGEQSVKKEVAHYPKMLSGMRVQGTPDTPYSLMEG